MILRLYCNDLNINHMKIPTQFQKILAVILTFSFVIEFTGCYSTRIVPVTDINRTGNYLIHAEKLIYNAYNVTISEGILSGNLDFNKKDSNPKIITSIYLSSDSLLKINNDQFSVPVTCIMEIKQKAPDPHKTKILRTTLIVAGMVVVAYTILAIVAFVSLAHAAENAVENCEIPQMSCE